METREVRIVQAFNDAINAADIERLASLMSDAHTFIDSEGTVVTGAQKVIGGWKEFFATFPDYRNQFESVFQKGNTVVAIGTASFTCKGKRGLLAGNRIEMPAAWKAIVENGKIEQWQVYADWTKGWKMIEGDRKAGNIAPGV